VGGVSSVARRTVSAEGGSGSGRTRRRAGGQKLQCGREAAPGVSRVPSTATPRCSCSTRLTASVDSDTEGPPSAGARGGPCAGRTAPGHRAPACRRSGPANRIVVFHKGRVVEIGEVTTSFLAQKGRLRAPLSDAVRPRASDRGGATRARRASCGGGDESLAGGAQPGGKLALGRRHPHLDAPIEKCGTRTSRAPGFLNHAPAKPGDAPVWCFAVALCDAVLAGEAPAGCGARTVFTPLRRSSPTPMLAARRPKRRVAWGRGDEAIGLIRAPVRPTTCRAYESVVRARRPQKAHRARRGPSPVLKRPRRATCTSFNTIQVALVAYRFRS